MRYVTDKPRAVFDIECYANFFCINFQCLTTGRRKSFALYEGHPLDRAGVIRIMRNFTLVGFNSNTYDVPMLKAALKMNATNENLKWISDEIVVRNLKPWDIERQYNLPDIPWLDTIDLIEPAPSVQVGLKLYMGRLNSKRLQDLPIEPDAIITPEQRAVLVEYCFNDLDGTADLYRHIEPQINLRCEMSEAYGIDLRSKSDAQVAEAVIRHELERIKGVRIEKPYIPATYTFKYQPPSFLEFKTAQMQEAFDIVCNATFRLGDEPKGDDDAEHDIVIKGVQMPKEIKGLKIKMGASIYRMGIGGLHSSEKRIAHFTDDEYLIRDADVASYYPAVIINCNLYPDHLGPDFLTVYRGAREKRIKAKRSGDKVTDMTYKIMLNGCFGKLGSKYSFLFAPNLMIQVTMTGQLALLMLIESLEEAGISVISANTDGIVSRIERHRVDDYAQIVKEWEAKTGFEMEFADYDALYSASVNSYLAVKSGGGVKQKGLYSFVGSKGSPAEKNPSNYVCIDAVIAYLTKGTPIEETIEWCADIRRFMTVRRVTGGALFRGEYLGKVVRFYHSCNSSDPILYAKNGNRVPKSDGAMPMMELGRLPSDIDYDYYIGEANKMLGELGVL